MTRTNEELTLDSLFALDKLVKLEEKLDKTIELIIENEKDTDKNTERLNELSTVENKFGAVAGHFMALEEKIDAVQNAVVESCKLSYEGFTEYRERLAKLEDIFMTLGVALEAKHERLSERIRKELVRS